ncbi:MAG: hypothetical protein H8E05_00600 [Bacteroidetes bacterium]|nr:hypothetical protein [Bacteroidota bacterium]
MESKLDLSRVSYISFLTNLISNGNNTIKNLLKIGYETSKDINFHDKIFYTAEKPECETYDFKVVEIEPIPYNEYSPWVIKNSKDLFESDYMLNFQADGMIRNLSAWSDEFYNYDYIGAPWDTSINGGNGGFSLRSKRLCEAASEIDLSGFNFNQGNISQRAIHNNEDVIICRTYENFLKYRGVKFAPNRDFLQVLDRTFWVDEKRFLR